MKNCFLMRKNYSPVILICCAFCSLGAQPRAIASYGNSADFDLAPLFLSDRAVTGAQRIRAIGPLLEWQRTGAGILKIENDIFIGPGRKYFGIRPFVSSVTVGEGDKQLLDLLWPLATWRRDMNETRWRFITAFGRNLDVSDPGSKYNFMVFPVIFAGRSEESQPYFALFPVGGTIRDALAHDKIVFVLFPLYLYMEQGETEAHNFLWPIISRRKGGGVEAVRVFPFYMHSNKKGQWEKTSVLWPFWNSVRYKYEQEKGGGFIFFPFFGRVSTGRQTTSWILPPFFKWAESDDGRQFHMPWPFVQYASGKTEKLYLWPLWGSKKTGERESAFALWPIIHSSKTRQVDGVTRNFKVLPVFYYKDHVVESDNLRHDGGQDDRRRTLSKHIKIWPLGFYRRNGNQHLLRILSLWPANQSPPIERNLAPIWSLFTSKRLGDCREDELLWGLISRERDGDSYKKWSWLMGLVKYKRESGQKQLRFLHFMKFDWK